MGSFEKLGILVIVVIIVMILAVAIYQWGGTGMEPGSLGPAAAGGAPSLVVNSRKPTPEKDYIDAAKEVRDEDEAAPASGSDKWPGGIPRNYTVKPGDSMWIVVARHWKLKVGFVDAIARANPGVTMRKLRPGQSLKIPNPEAYWPSRKSPQPYRDLRVYEIAEGDLLETIAREHLGRRSRWREILEVNPGLDPRRMRPGQRIYLPAR